MSPELVKLDREIAGLNFLCELVLRQHDNMQLHLCLVERLTASRRSLRDPTGYGKTMDYLVLCVAAAAETVCVQSRRGSGERFLGAVETLRHELVAAACEIALLRGEVP